MRLGDGNGTGQFCSVKQNKPFLFNNKSMNRTFLRPLSAVLFGLLVMTASCKKDVDPVTPATGGSSTPSFVGTRWQMSAFLLDPSIDFDGDGKVDNDLLPFMPACDRDNSIVFEKSGVVTESEGQVDCNHEPSEAKKPDQWRYNAGTRTITLTDGSDPTDVSTWEVVEASSRVLTIRTTVTEDGQTLKATIHWRAI